MERNPASRNPPRKPRKEAERARAIDSEFLHLAQESLKKRYFPRIERCVRELSEQDLWWRPNAESNSVGNLVLHLAGNAQQWIVSGLGGAPDVRRRDEEFSEQGPIPGPVLVAHLGRQVKAACRVIAKLTPQTLAARHSIQGFDVTGLDAVQHVAEHFAYHTGQIIYITKLRLGIDLKFTRLPSQQQPRNSRRLRP